MTGKKASIAMMARMSARMMLRGSGRAGARVFPAVFATLALLFMPGVAGAQDAFTGSGSASGSISLSVAPAPYIDPFRERNQVRVAVFGDSLATNLEVGLGALLASKPVVEVVQHTRPGSGFTRPDYFDWNKQLADILASERVDVAVVLIGSNDNQQLRTPGGRFRTDTDRWRQGYAQRVDQFIRQLKRHGAAVYWMEIPISRRRNYNDFLLTVNEIQRERARRQQVKYIASWNEFIDADGQFITYGRDDTGRVRRLRARDGIHFTDQGAIKLARLAQTPILFDLSRAEAESNVQLTGKNSISSDGLTPGEGKPDDGLAETGSLRADVGITPESDLADMAPTPAAGAAVAAQDGDGDTPGQQLETVAQEQNAALRVLLRGETLSPRSGRADDFAWPREVE